MIQAQNIFYALECKGEGCGDRRGPQGGMRRARDLRRGPARVPHDGRCQRARAAGHGANHHVGEGARPPHGEDPHHREV